MSTIKIKPVSIGWMLKCSIAGKHIEEEYPFLSACTERISFLQAVEHETFVGQITIIPILKYVEIIKQR